MATLAEIREQLDTAHDALTRAARLIKEAELAPAEQKQLEAYKAHLDYELFSCFPPDTSRVL